MLVLDAFLDRSPPVHLLTLEAFRLYLRHVGPRGVLAFDVSNPFLELSKAVRANAAACGLYTVDWRDSDVTPPGVFSQWVLASRSRQVLESAFPADMVASPAASDAPRLLWTDDFTPILRILRMPRPSAPPHP